MPLFGNLWAKSKPAAKPVPVVRAKYDAAERGDDYRHWGNADAFSADAALSPMVRRTLRNRARYEIGRAHV